MATVNKTYSLDEDIVNKVNDHSKQTGIMKSKIVEFALKEYLEKNHVHKRA